MIIDSHCHCWPRWPYRRHSHAEPLDVERHGSGERLRESMTVAGVGHALIVAADIGEPPIDDSAYALNVAQRHPRTFSVVADIDSRWSATYHDGGTAARVEALPDLPALAGISHYLADEPDEWWNSPSADETGRTLTKRRMLLSLHAPPVWHADVGRWALRHPDVPILMHHVGLARDAEELTGLLGLAEAPNVFVKASGLVYTDPAGGPDHAVGVELLRTVISAFGPDRVAWGSDFPVSAEHGIDMVRGLELVGDVAGRFGASATEAIMGGTAAQLLMGRNG